MFSTSHSLCCQPWWFPKAFAFYDPLNLLALELGFVLKSEQREAFWSLTLICESITVQFQTFVLHLKQILVEKDAPSSRTMKSSFFRRLDSFGDVSPFLVGGNNHIFGAYPPTLNISKLCCETTAAIISSAWFFRLSPFSRSRRRLFRCTATHFWSSRKHCIAHGNDAKDLLWNFWISCSPIDTKPSADNSMHYSATKSMHECI